MADFRKMLYAFALGALAIGVTVPASAQQMTCNSTAVDPIIRAESYTDLGGDYIVTCTGGTPTTAGTAVPGVTITLFTNGVITSRVTQAGINGNPSFLEALLIVDDPNTTFTYTTGAAATSRHPILACGTGLTQIDQSNPGECDVIATGTNTGSNNAYDGTSQAFVLGAASSRPNVFQGQTVPNSNNSAVQFIGVPLDPPGQGQIHTFRITNVRLSGVTASGGSGQVSGFGGLFQVQAFVSFTTPNSVATQTNTLPIATVRNGLNPVVGVGGATYPQCGPFNPNPNEGGLSAGSVSGGSITVSEGFASSFKPRNWALIQANGAYSGGSDWTYTATNATLNTTAVDVNQDVPGVYYSTEAGFEYTGPGTAFASPTQNPPAGIASSPGTACDSTPATACVPAGTGTAFTATNGLWNTGIASNGTRFVFTFSNVPIGSGATVPSIVGLFNGNVTPVQTGVLVYVAGADANGAGGTLSPNTAIPALTEGGPSTSVVYEVVFADFIQVEHATVPVTLTPTINLGATTPVNGTPQISTIANGTAGFAPFYSPSFVPAPAAPEPLYPAASGLPIPRFVNETNNIVPLWSFTKCACDIMFPWVVADGTFNTSIVVANTSLDPGRGVANLSFGSALPQSGNVTWWFYGTDDAPSVGPGGSVSHNGSAVDNSGQNTTLTTTNAAYSLTTFNLIPPGSYAVLSVSTNAGVAAAGTPVISNAISNPTGAASTVGTQILQPPVPAGATSGEPTGFAGYVIAQSQFRYCHGIAAIHANQAGFGTQTYLGIILDNGSGLPARTSNLGEVLGN